MITADDLGAVGRIPVRLGQRAGVGPNACLQPPLATGRGPLCRRADRLRGRGQPLSRRGRDGADRDRLGAAARRRRRAPRERSGHAGVASAAGGNVIERLSARAGNAESGLAASERRLVERFAIQRHTGVPMETRGLTAAHDPGTGMLTLWGVAKVPHFNRRVLADLLGHPEHLIHFIELEVGGGFGVRGEFYPEDFVVPWTAMRLGRARAVDRGPARAPDGDQPLARSSITRSRSACGATARSSALRDRFIVDLGAYIRTHGVVVPELTIALLPGPYRVPNYECEALCVMTNKTPTGTYRGPGRYEGTFVRERLIDSRGGGARASIRPTSGAANFIDAAEMPYEVRRRDAGPEDRLRLRRLSLRRSSRRSRRSATRRARAEQALARGARALSRDRRRLRPGEGRARPVGVRARRGRRARAASSSTPASPRSGRGSRPRWPRSSPSELAMAAEDVTVVHGDSARVPFGVGGFASRGAAVALPGGARGGAQGPRRRSSASRPRCSRLTPATSSLEAGAVHVRGLPDARVTLRRARARGGARPAGHGARALGRALLRGARDDLSVRHARGRRRGRCRRPGVWRSGSTSSTYDVGRAINPMIVDGQIVGAPRPGHRAARSSRSWSTTTRASSLATTFMDYLVPTAMDMPEATIVRILEETPTPLNPLGVKGVGEGGSSGAGAAIANAVADALAPLGVAITELPLSPDRIARLVRQRGARP